MNIDTHPVAPEKVMAFLDGELSVADAQGVSIHIENCAECAHVAERLRSASESLSAWRVPNVPLGLENSFKEIAAKTASGRQIRGSLFTHPTFWTWTQWAIASGMTVAAVLLVSALFLPNLLRSRVETRQITAYEGKQQPEREGSAGKFQINGRPIADQQSKGPISAVTLNSPGIAADSNGLFHGLGDHTQTSFSIDGQPRSDQQSKIFSADNAGPMIARVVSLSVVVKDFGASRSSLDIILERHHGYSAQLTVSTPEGTARSLQASLRIPVLELSATVSDLKTLGRVENESQSGEEVTHQHGDLVARLRNARDTEQRFRAILQQHTGNVGEVLEVEQGIARVRGDIERMEGEQKALEHRVDFATIELQLTEEYKAQLNPPATPVSTRMHNAFVSGYHNALDTVLGIVLFFAEYSLTLMIWILIIALPAILVSRQYRRKLSAV